MQALGASYVGSAVNLDTGAASGMASDDVREFKQQTRVEGERHLECYQMRGKIEEVAEA